MARGFCGGTAILVVGGRLTGVVDIVDGSFADFVAVVQSVVGWTAVRRFELALEAGHEVVRLAGHALVAGGAPAGFAIRGTVDRRGTACGHKQSRQCQKPQKPCLRI